MTKVHYSNDAGYSGHLCDASIIVLSQRQSRAYRNTFICCSRIRRKVNCVNCLRILSKRLKIKR